MYYIRPWCVPLIVAGGLLASNECEPISEKAAQRLAEYVHMNFQFPSTLSLELSSSEPVGGTCFRKVHFRSKDPDRAIDLVLFVSPDQHFLSRDLLDTTIDPAEQKKR